ncbi:MAG: coniferyl aldehyde dehydrogenase, partial [Candidatus Eremiobacteraeota bacterium]|nr:coniferyl aldehyde dehydrogenase [Candidatus Eremiobacteraeota bacterium]
MASSSLADTQGAVGALAGIFERQRVAFSRDTWPDRAARAERLRLLLRAVLDHREEIAAAVDADFGGRSWHETMFVDVFGVVSLIRYSIANLRRWMRPQ